MRVSSPTDCTTFRLCAEVRGRVGNACLLGLATYTIHPHIGLQEQHPLNVLLISPERIAVVASPSATDLLKDGI